jgi:hypothetical protein
MITLRPYRESDFEEIHSWWTRHNECPPVPGMMVTNGTFVLEHDNKPIMTLTAFVTQSKEISYLEGFCAKPGVSKEITRECGPMLWEYAFEFLRHNGRKRVVILTNKEGLAKRYKELGMEENMKELISLGRVL